MTDPSRHPDQDQRFRELAALQKRILADKARIDRLTQQKLDAERRLAQLKSSLSWRITAPLRYLGRLLRPRQGRR